LSQFRKYRSSENLKFNNLGIFQSSKFRISMEKNPFNFSKAKFHFKYFGLLWVKRVRKSVDEAKVLTVEMEHIIQGVLACFSVKIGVVLVLIMLEIR